MEMLAVGGALLFVPGDRPERYEKAVATGADHVIVDLEDAVAEERKGEARAAVTRWLEDGGRAMVRLNAAGTRHHRADLGSVSGLARAVILPKAENPDVVANVVSAATAPVLALIESPAGVLNAARIAETGVAALVFGNVDLAACVGVDPASHRALLSARSTLVYASAAAGLQAPIDGVTTLLDSEPALRADLDQARDLGFAGKLCIHPRQVAATRTAFVPTAEELRWAQAVLAAVADPRDASPIAQGAPPGQASRGGALAVEGQMVDAPLVRRARALVRRAAGQAGNR